MNCNNGTTTVFSLQVRETTHLSLFVGELKLRHCQQVHLGLLELVAEEHRDVQSARGSSLSLLFFLFLLPGREATEADT